MESHPARPARPAHPARVYLGISEVCRQLITEFPDVTISKIRFWEAEGLITPARTPAGYRRFAAADVDRLRYILSVQRDHYLPLRVIKEQLAAGAGQPGEPAGQPGEPAGRGGPGQRAGAGRRTAGEHRAVTLSRRELLDAAGIDEDQLAELEEFGLIRRNGRQYGGDALEVAGTVAALAAYGVQARHLRAVRAAAEREIALIEQIIGPALRQRKPGAREQASRMAGQLAALSLRLHRALVANALAEAGLQAGQPPGPPQSLAGPPRGLPLPGPPPGLPPPETPTSLPAELPCPPDARGATA